MHLLTAAGLLGRATSVSAVVGPLTVLSYAGHVIRDGAPVRMRDFAAPVPPRDWTTPTVLIIGTSMSAGKTATARAAIRELDRRGLSVAGAKLTGAGRYRDILTMRDAGAETILDFVDAGLPSSVCAPHAVDPKNGERLGDLLAAALAGEEPLGKGEPMRGENAV